MSKNEQFKGWAKAVWEEMQSIGKGTYVDANGFTHDMLAVEQSDVYVALLARAGYELVGHALDACEDIEVACVYDDNHVDAEHWLPKIPDLPTVDLLPEEDGE